MDEPQRLLSELYGILSRARFSNKKKTNSALIFSMLLLEKKINIFFGLHS